MNQARLPLGKLSVDDFLKNYWQKKPLLIRNAFPNFKSPIDANLLSGFAMENFVESRIVHSDNWQVEHGPFSEQRLQSLPEKHWTLLVQGVDQLDHRVGRLLDHFRFLPSWRLDDIMVSYAVDGGSVGPHFDQYDVFLLQADGQRRWQVGEMCNSSNTLLGDTELAILKEFLAKEDWVLDPGDMLYLPPGFSHWGIAVGECMTYSIGFRAPSVQDIVSHYCDHRLASLDDSRRYRDGEIKKNDDAFQIDQEALSQVKSLLTQALDDPQSLHEWFGCYMTTPRYPEILEDSEGLPLDSLDSNFIGTDDTEFERAPSLRLAFSCENTCAHLFINGEHWMVSEAFAKFVCHHKVFTTIDINAAIQDDKDQIAFEEIIDVGFIQTK